MSLNNPYYPYPKFPLSGYYDLDVYNQNLISLNDYIKEMTRKINKKVLFHLTIGSAAEELCVENKTDIGFNWQQLLPFHLQNCVKNNLPVYNVIISPSRMFKDDYTPLFIENTPHFQWYKKSNNTFKSAVYDITVTIFYCPLPSQYDYTKILSKLKKANIEMFTDDYISQFVQNDNDKQFIEDFYNNLESLFLKVNFYGGFVTCFSYAVFNDETSNCIYNNYHLFKEIKKLFSLDYRINNRFLAEWFYRLGFYCMVIHNKSDYETTDYENNIVSFVNPTDLNVDQHTKINIIDLSGDKILIKNYNSHKIHKKISIKNHIKNHVDPNSLYTCIYLELTNKEYNHFDYVNLLNNKFDNNEEKIVLYLRAKTFKKIFNNPKDYIYQYLKSHEHLCNLNSDLELYENYITEDGFSIKAQKVRSMIKIPKSGMCFDELELEGLSKVLHTQIIVYDHKLKFINKFGEYNDFIELIYDYQNMTFEKYTNPQNSKSLKLEKPVRYNY